MTAFPSSRLAIPASQVWQLDAAAQLLATLDERYAAQRAALQAPLEQRFRVRAQLDAADAELCVARARFLDAVCELHVEAWSQGRLIANHEHVFDALDVLWDFEAAWEDALDTNADPGHTGLESGDEAKPCSS